VAERTSTGERLANAVIEIIVTQADGTPLWSGESFPLSPGKRIDWRVSVKPNGALDGTLIAQVILRDRKVSTVESLEREERERAEAERQATLARERAARERAEAERQAVLKRERERVASIKSRGWAKDVERAVIERKVMLGMTSEQVSLSWGPPRKVNKTVRASGVSEQWVYSDDSYVYLDNGLVTVIQTSR
jgi:regulator of protease activity HflC (stomatin/prohibitin superfamily)